MASRRASRAASGFPPAGSTRGGLAGAEGGGGGGLNSGGGGGTNAIGEVGGGEITSLWTFLSSSIFLSCSNSLAALDLI